jgi:hypothetical protein
MVLLGWFLGMLAEGPKGADLVEVAVVAVIEVRHRGC